MTDLAPSEVKNLSIYGSPPLEWSRAHDALAKPGGDHRIYLATLGPDGRPHAARVGALWHDGDMNFVSGPSTRKSRNLAANPACTLAIGLPEIDLVLEGTAARVTDEATLETVAARYRAHGWPAEVAGDAFTAPYNASGAGPPPWHLYRITFHTAFGEATAEPYGATRWRFTRGDG